MKYFITTDNGHIEDFNGNRITFNRLKNAQNYINKNHNEWCGNESQTYYIGTDDGVNWVDKKIITL